MSISISRYTDMFQMSAILETTSDKNEYIGEKYFFAKVKSGSEMAKVMFVPGHVEEFGKDYIILGN